jgi:hypothetical protein
MSTVKKPTRGKPCGESWIHYKFICHEGETQQSKAGAILYTLRKISKLRSRTARARKLAELKRRLKDDEFLSKVIEAVGLGHGQDDVAKVGERLAKLHSLLESSSVLPYAERLKRDLNVVNTSRIPLDTMNAASETKVSDKVKEGITLIRDYSEITQEVNDLIKSIKVSPVTSQEEYDEAFEKINSLFKRLTNTVESAKKTRAGIKGIDEHLDAIGTISREALPGYRVAMPSTLDVVAKKSISDPCP